MVKFVSKRILLLFVYLHFAVGTSVIGSLDTWSWVAFKSGTDRVAEWVSPLNTQEIDINKLHVFSNISELQSDVKVSMRFRNPHQLRLYLRFTVRMGDVSRMKGFKIDHMGTKCSAQKMHQTRAERLVERLRSGGSTSSGIIMTRTSPYLKEFDVHVFLESRTSMTFDLNYKEKLQPLLSANWYEHQIRIHPYQLVEDFQMNVVMKQPRTGTLSHIDAYWDSFSVSNTVRDPWGLQREPLTIRPWNGGSRINLSPIRSDMTNPRSWESDLIVIFEWDSTDFGFEKSSWSSYSDIPVQYESSDTYSNSIGVILPAVVTHVPHITDFVLTTPTENRITAGDLSETSSEKTSINTRGHEGSGDDGEDSFIGSSWEEGSGGDLETDSPSGSSDRETESYNEQSFSATDGGVAVGSSYVEDSSFDSSESDFDFTERSTSQIDIEEFNGKKHAHFKIYQKETLLEFNVPSSGTKSRFISMFKRILKKLFPKTTKTSQD